jgi:hypothetical protein
LDRHNGVWTKPAISVACRAASRTLSTMGWFRRVARHPTDKSFLVLFFKKEPLSFFW